jgi:hypothetical protein
MEENILSEIAIKLTKSQGIKLRRNVKIPHEENRKILQNTDFEQIKR